MTENIELTNEPLAPPTPSKKWLKITATFFLGLGLFLFFTFLKLPDGKLKNYIQGQIAFELSKNGMSLISEKNSLSMLFGARYKMEKVQLYLPNNGLPISLDSVQFSPSIFSMLTGKLGGALSIRKDKMKLDLDGSMKNEQVDFDYDLSNIQSQELNLLPTLAGIQGKFTLDGSGSGSLNTAQLTTLKGDFELKLSKILLPEQSIAGFKVPEMNINDGNIKLLAHDQKIVFKQFELGKKDSKTDDLYLMINGEIKLGRTINNSELKLKINLKPSEKVLKAFVLLDALSRSGKQSDGSYLVELTGLLSSPIPTPIKQGT